MQDDIPHFGKPKRRAITLEDTFWELAKTIGEGNASRGIRYALATLARRDERTISLAEIEKLRNV